jgi:hypothetical protein
VNDDFVCFVHWSQVGKAREARGIKQIWRGGPARLERNRGEGATEILHPSAMILALRVKAREMPAGYSGTPLAKKLGIAEGATLFAVGMPASVRAEIERTACPRYLARAGKGLAAAHVFHTSAAKLAVDLKKLRPLLAPDGMVWVSWPKKAAKVATDITEDQIRKIALPMGYVDVKVCAVDEIWSGLKLVIRKALR